MPHELWHDVAHRIYDFIAHLLSLGWSVAGAVARAIERWVGVGPDFIGELGGLAVQAFAAGSIFTGMGPDAATPEHLVPEVPPAEGQWRYVGYWEDDAGNRQYFEIFSRTPLSYREVGQKAKELLDAGKDIDSPTSTTGDDVVYPAAHGEEPEGPMLDLVISRIERR